jgi:hypothetical protein
VKRFANVLAALAGALIALLLFTSVASPTTTKPASAVAPDGAVFISGLDLHDGTILQVGTTYYMYGTMYGCGFEWLITNTPWCGFGVSTAPDLTGPWSTPTLLFSANAPDPYNAGKTYQATCGATGAGCFSPRMIQRTGWGANDGVYILWFNAPWYKTAGAAHAYMAMGCNGPAGPCGATAGAPYGSTHRPSLHQCSGANGDPGLSISVESNAPWLLCPMVGTTAVGLEKLSTWGTDGANVGSAAIAGLTKAEAMGMWEDPSGTWYATFADPNCGYCAGTGTGYMSAPAAAGPWSFTANVGVSGFPVNGRRLISADTCGGQADTVFWNNGQPWEKINLWRGTRNETSAGIYLAPLTLRTSAGVAGDGTPSQGPFIPWSCGQ